ncbi:MAG TPA: Tim44 domain-containing protein [Pararhizobium sp.]|uniref:Tim44 domain-containing protein n=1 Tax=Pararhizobium sp. TaxID=1977563 RepID=UPI002BF6E386|nr:Tim44 domain-containing protein [Pararhizobium sp.]HTO33262.1 Tim44 domain-containing protein [Pararhizobium sp.]
MLRFGRVLATFAVASMVMLTVVDLAEARRGGSGFGSRGSRTFSAPPVTRTAPADATPINRTMTPQQGNQNQSAGPQSTAQRPGAQRPGGLFGGFAGSMLGGLALGGLIGMMMGTGFGGMAGMLGMILQMALIAGAVMLAMRFFRNRQTAAPAGYSPRQAAAGASPMQGFGTPGQGMGSGMPSFKIPSIGGGGSAARPAPARQAGQSTDEIGVGEDDLSQFEAMLKQVQAAYAAEDYGTLRKLTTPEAMSWLAEELSENATKGVKNEVSDVQLVQGDVAEAWNEDGDDYATVAMRYESIDVTRDRATGRVVEGDPDQPTEAVELWTFLRKRGGDWQVSAIQGMAA